MPQAKRHSLDENDAMLKDEPPMVDAETGEVLIGDKYEDHRIVRRYKRTMVMTRDEFRSLMGSSQMNPELLRAVYRVMCCGWSVIAAAAAGEVWPSQVSHAIARVMGQRMPDGHRWRSRGEAVDEWLSVRVMIPAFESVPAGLDERGKDRFVELPVFTSAAWLREDLNVYLKMNSVDMSLGAQHFGREMSLRNMRTTLDMGQSVYSGIRLLTRDETLERLKKNPGLMRRRLENIDPPESVAADCKDDREA